MQILNPSSENEMVHEFLKMELKSDRYGKKIKDALKDLKID